MSNWTRLAGDHKQFPEVCAIYVLRSPTARLYVGKSMNLQSRMRYHIVNGARSNTRLGNSFKSHGVNNWDVRWIEVKDDSAALRWEVSLIKRFGTNSPEHLNMTDGGDGVSGWVPSDETKEKQRIAAIGRTASDETRENISKARKGKCTGVNNPMYGRTGENSPAYGRTGEKHPFYGKKHSDEAKQRQSDAMKGEKNHFYGKKHSEESKAKQRKAHRLRRLRAVALKQWQSGWLMI